MVAQHRGDRADDAVRVSPPQLRQHRQQRGVRQQARRENLGVLHLPRHDRLGDARLLQQLDQRAELAEGNPVDRALRAGRGLVQFGKGLFLGGDDRDVVPLRHGSIEHEKRKAAVTGDESQLHRLHTTKPRRTRRYTKILWFSS